NTFVPNGILTRAQLAVVMRNYMEGKYEVEVSEDILDRFPDKPKTEYWYYGAMKYAVSAGLLSGNSDGTLAATGNVTRAQAAVIFTSFADKYFYTKCDHFFEEASCTLSERCVYCGMKKGLPEGHTVDSSYNCITAGVCSVCGADVKASKLIHNFVPATCDMPAVCLDCDTVRGTPTNKHNWIPATCTSDEYCSLCGRVGDNYMLGHDEIKPTCNTVGKCKRCGAQTAPALGHSFSDATCTKARYCKRCNIMSGKPLGHNMVNNVCKRCKYTDITDPVKKTMHYLQYHGKNLIGAGDTYDSRDAMMCSVYHNEANDRVEFSSVYYFTNGSRQRVELYIYAPKVSGSYEYWAVYYDSNGNKVASGYGSIKTGSVYEGMSFTVSNYWGRENLKSSFNSRLAKQLPDTLEACDELLNKYCDCDIKDFGFKYF
ncbi:MAG: S-layer homology domain-containing protein, partial [Clostridia bacterium]|nr:S-layer homology domain-containing protein [Clostridia bacterium]